MKQKKNIETDILVIGAGLAGMVAASRSSSLGLKTVQAGNSSVLFFASGLFDLLGVYPVESGKMLTDPYSGIQKLQEDQPCHPYAKVSQNQIRASFEFVRNFLQSAGLSYHFPGHSAGQLPDRLPDGLPDHLPDHYSGQSNTKILTSVGTLKPTYMVPETFLKGCDLHRQEKKLLIVDFKGLRGFSARQAASGLGMEKGGIATLSIDLPQNINGLNPVPLAKLFENPEFVQDLADKICTFDQRADLVGMPAICGIRNSMEILKAIEAQTGKGVFEIPGMPPSIPGLRLKNAFEKQLSGCPANNQADNPVKFLSNAKVVFQAMEGDTFILKAVNDHHETGIRAGCVILASGRFPWGGLFATRNNILETVFNLPVFQPDKRDDWHRLNFFDPKGHRINRAGLETDDQFRPLIKKGNQEKASKGEPAFENLYAAGSILAHNDWVRLKSGAGVSCVSAVTAVNNFYEKNQLK